jgi:membrane-bound lytic murein transglycosylase A
VRISPWRLALLGLSIALAPADLAAESPMLKPVAYSSLLGWTEDAHEEALGAFLLSCREMRGSGHGFKRDVRYGGSREDWVSICQKAEDATSTRSFFESEFQAFEVVDPDRPQAVLTGYYEPLAEGRLQPDNEFDVPIYAKPADLSAFTPEQQSATGLAYGRLVDGKPKAYFTRREIEEGALKGRGQELLWLKSWEDAFFIHIQGSGRIRLADGTEVRLSYAAKTGRPYTAIGGILIARGILTRETNSMQSIRSWMAANPEEARALMWQNESFVFFRKTVIDNPALGALGAQQVNLTPERSLAVDRSIWMFGTPVWIETKYPPETPDGEKPYHRLMIAQDTGSAIKGAARGDIYWGWGDRAALIAGHMKGKGRMVVLLPKAVVKGLEKAK